MTEKPLDRPPVENELVIAKYEEGDWYRGKVTKVEGSDCEVSFVDFGDKVKCAWSIVVPVDETIMKVLIIYYTKVAVACTNQHCM